MALPRRTSRVSAAEAAAGSEGFISGEEASIRSSLFFDGFFDGPFQQGGGRQQREERRKSALNMNSINAHEYFNKILAETGRQPYIIMFHSDWCFMCMRVEPIWARLVEELEPVGFGIATVHAGQE